MLDEELLELLEEEEEELLFVSVAGAAVGSAVATTTLGVLVGAITGFIATAVCVLMVDMASGVVNGKGASPLGVAEATGAFEAERLQALMLNTKTSAMVTSNTILV
jgi:hypothetical protein